MSKTAKIGLVIGGAIALAPFFSFAETHAEMRQSIQEERRNLQQNIQIQRQELRGKRAELRDEIAKKREAFREEAQKRRDELKKKLGEVKAKRIEQFFTNMGEKFEKAIDRLGSLADRIEDRLNKAETNGKDVAALKAMLVKAREKITAAETALTDAKAKYAEATASNQDFKVAFRKVHELAKGVTSKMREAHGALVDVINSTKGLGTERPATTTPETD